MPDHDRFPNLDGMRAIAAQHVILADRDQPLQARQFPRNLHVAVATEIVEIEIAEIIPLFPAMLRLPGATVRAYSGVRDLAAKGIITLEIEAPKSDTPQELIARRQQIETLKDERNDIEAEIKKSARR